MGVEPASDSGYGDPASSKADAGRLGGTQDSMAGDYRNIISGTSQNVVGIAVAAVAIVTAAVVVSKRRSVVVGEVVTPSADAPMVRSAP